ncbi:unnamed protein product [Rotaria sordida]|uniref:Phosphatidylinositol-4-phosphate 3-kinase n=1 Tax=Rotaria sordida TaxID=392033 RepID=A0A814GKD0_9BILA|nr:unnamed protein product [Rotaria sordida]
MIPSDCVSSTLKNSLPLLLSPLNLSSTINNSTKSLPVTPVSTPISPKSFTSNESSDSTPLDQVHFPYPDAFPLPRQLTPSGDESRSLKQEEINQNLIDLNVAYKLSALDTFDPLKQPNQSPILPSELDKVIPNTSDVVIQITDTSVISTVSPALPYPIKLRLKLSTCSELKPISRFVQQIRNERQSQQTSTDGIFYCKHVQHLTSQHIEQNQLPVTLYIFTDSSTEPIRLPNISLQSTVANILYQLLEKITFDYNQSILKLRSCEEYLRHDDILCDIEYVYNCINSLKQLQFVLVKKPICIFQPKQDNISFEQFCLNQSEKYFQTMKQTKLLESTKSLNKNRQKISLDQTRSFLSSNPRWLEEFRQNINLIFEQIEQCFNNLINPNSSILSINKQIKLNQELIGYCKKVQNICSDIQSSSFIDTQHELKFYTIQLIKQSQNENEQVLNSQISENLIQLLYDLLLALIKYIQAYCQAFLIPYDVEIYNDENKSIDIEQVKSLSTITTPNPRSIIESSKLFSVHIDSLFSLPSNIKTIRVVVHLCYGNEIKAKQMTKLMSFVRHSYSDSSSQIHFDQRLIFNDIYLCGLQREALLLFEIYASFIDDTDSSLSSLVSEVFDGISMRLIGWCSQALFDHEHNLISGEYYLGIFDAATTIPTGFYSLRNILDRDCSILTITIPHQSFFLPNIQARKDMCAKNFTEITRDKQEYLCRLLDRPSLLLNDHSIMITNESSMDNRKQQLSPKISGTDYEFTNESHFLWSNRDFLIHKPYALPKLLRSRSVWDYPSLIDIYSLVNEINHHRKIDAIESFELLLPAFPDMYIRSCAYRSLILHITSYELMIYLPQILQIIKFDYYYSSLIIEYLLQQCINDYYLAHKLYWYLRQLLLTENIHFIRYYYIFMSLLYIIEEYFYIELENEYNLCINLKNIGSELKNNTLNKGYYLIEELKKLNMEVFQSNQRSCRLPCQFSFITNNIDIKSCSIFHSLTCPMKLVFNSIDLSSEKYYSIYKIGDDLRQDQIVLQLLTCMDKIWKSNDIDFRLSLFNVVQTQERCGFIEMITESETLLEIEKPLGTIKGSFGESALYDWLSSHNANERDFRIALDNLTYSCAGYCVATYILGIGDRHNENIMVKKSGHLFHIDFGKYLGDRQKFGWFNRDRAPFIFTKQMLYAMSDGGTSNDAMHRFVDLCCNAFCILRQNSSLLLILLSHLCSSNVPNLTYDAVRFVYDRLAPSLNYAESITHFTELIVDSLNSTWTTLNGLIHKIAQPTNSNNSLGLTSKDTILSFVPKTYTVSTDGKILFVQVVNYEKRIKSSKYYLYELKVVRLNTTYNYRTYNEFYEFYERLNKQFPLIGLDLKFSEQTEDNIIAQRHLRDINEFLENLFHLTSEITESDLVCTFFHTTQRDQQINDAKEKSNEGLAPHSSQISSTNNPSKIRIQLTYDNRKLFVMARHANNLPLINGNEPKPYCKCYLFPDESKLTKRKGKLANSRNPIFNDTFTYEMDLAEIQKRILHVGIWNNVLNVGNHVLGTVDIVLSDIDWSKENACDYTFTTRNS